MSRVVLLFVVLGTSAGCSLGFGPRRTASAPVVAAADSASPETARRSHVVYVTGNGFHTGFVLPTEAVRRDIWPEVDWLGAHPWVEVGWGSEIFYRAESITAPVVVGAILPNPSVLHVVGWDQPPEQLFQGDLVRLTLDDDEFDALCRHVHDTYARDSSGDVEPLGPGIYGDSLFFRADGRYYFPKTCNVWTARGLKKAGVPIVPELCSAGDAVLSFARRDGRTIRRR